MKCNSASPFNPLCNRVFIGILLVLATVIVYFPVTQYGFVNFDDPGYFFTNSHVLGGLSWANLKWAFTTGDQANWHPLTWLSLMWDAQFFGHGAAAPHVTNLLLHAANVLLVFILFQRLTDKIWRSAALAMLFAVHPLHVESVAWVAERKDVLSGFFGLLTLLCYAHYVQARIHPQSPCRAEALCEGGSIFHSRSCLFYALSLFFFICGLMSKPMLVTLPFVMLLLDFWPLQRSCRAEAQRRRVNALTNRQFNPPPLLEKIPFLLLSAAASVVTFIVQQKGGAVSALTRIPMGLRVENAFVSYTRYLGKIFWPVNLAVLYPLRGGWPLLAVIASVVLFAVLCFAAIVLRKKYPFIFVGWFWFAGMLVPVIGIVQVGAQAMADRYAYLPIVGIFIVVIWTVGEICAARRPPRSVLLAVTACLLVACAARARNQIANWENDQTLFGHALAVTKNNYVASLDLGYWYSINGRISEALKDYDRALRMSPNDPTALYDVGNAFAKLGYWNQAIEDYRGALRINPKQPDILDNLGFALAQTRQLAEATACFEAALKLKPDSVGAHNNLATVFFIRGDYQDAAREFAAAARLAPQNPQIMVNLGDTLGRLGRKDEAFRCYQRALRLQPNNPAIQARLKSLWPKNPD